MALLRTQDSETVRRGAVRGAALGAALGLVSATVAVPMLQPDMSRAYQLATFVVGLFAGGPIGTIMGSLVALLVTTDPDRRLSRQAQQPARPSGEQGKEVTSGE